MNDRITNFRDENHFLSNFHPCDIVMDGLIYKSTEHAYQAAKTLDQELRKDFLYCSAGQAKRRGAALTPREDWREVNIGIMRDLLLQKFEDPTLQEKLLATGDAVLIEGNDWGDDFWGMVYAKDSGELVGQNILGQLLMDVRDHYQTLRGE